MPPRTIPLRPESWSSDSLKCIASSKVIWGGRVGTSVGHRFDNHRTLGCKGLVPRGSDLLGLIHADTRKAQHLSVAGELEIRHILARLELRITGHDALFPSHLVQVVVGKYHDDQPRIAPLLPVVGDGHQFVDA